MFNQTPTNQIVHESSKSLREKSQDREIHILLFSCIY